MTTMTREHGICEECGRRTAVTYAHANVCERCWPVAGQHMAAAKGEPREAGNASVCRDCGAELSGARQGRCLDCEVSHAFDVLGEKIQTRRLTRHPLDDEQHSR